VFWVDIPIVGSVIGGVIGTVGEKALGSLSDIAISKVVEVYDKQKRENIGEMGTVSELMVHLSRRNDKLFQDLMTYARDSDQETQIDSVVKQATTAGSSLSILYPFYQQLICQYSILTNDQCLVATQLTENIFSDLNDSEYFVLTPIPNENAPEDFALTVDLLVLR
jgi:hypothetical protein